MKVSRTGLLMGAAAGSPAPVVMGAAAGSPAPVVIDYDGPHQKQRGFL